MRIPKISGSAQRLDGHLRIGKAILRRSAGASHEKLVTFVTTLRDRSILPLVPQSKVALDPPRFEFEDLGSEKGARLFFVMSAMHPAFAGVLGPYPSKFFSPIVIPPEALSTIKNRLFDVVSVQNPACPFRASMHLVPYLTVRQTADSNQDEAYVTHWAIGIHFKLDSMLKRDVTQLQHATREFHYSAITPRLIDQILVRFNKSFLEGRIKSGSLFFDPVSQTEKFVSYLIPDENIPADINRDSREIQRWIVKHSRKASDLAIKRLERDGVLPTRYVAMMQSFRFEMGDRVVYFIGSYWTNRPERINHVSLELFNAYLDMALKRLGLESE